MQTNGLNRVAGISLLENPYSIDGIYDYAIPPELASEIVPGAFVTVPFGTANHRRHGLVVQVKDKSDYAELKQILTVCPELIFLSEELLGLCHFMKQRLLCTTGEAVRAMIPTSMLSRLETFYSPVPEHIPTGSDDLPSSDLFVYNALCESGRLRAETLKSRFGVGADAILKRLCRNGYVQKNTVVMERADGKYERIWFCVLAREDAYALLDGRTVDEKKLTSEKQKKILSALLDSEQPLSTAELGEQIGGVESSLKTMQKKGIVESRELRIDRNPYGDVAVTGQTPIRLNGEQSQALDRLTDLAFSDSAKAALLYGVTGSGKTAVMVSLIDRLLAHRKGVIVLFPEIALTPQSVSVFCARYGTRVAVIHSALSAGERYDAYRRIREGAADVIIGTRSAVFAPVRDLGAIIIDEEQETTYKSDQNPKYHARDVARYRCAANRAFMLLCSATPSLESYHKAKEGVYTLVRLTHRYGNAELPQVVISDRRREAGAGNLSPIGERMAQELCRVYEHGEQAVLFLNRRGYNHFVSCRSCGEAVTCSSCSVAMTYHTKRGTYSDGDLVCHWCGRHMPMPQVCPSCGSAHLARMGFGTQRVEEELGTFLPNARLLRMDTDTTSSKFAYDEMLADFRAHRADILLGTQMVTKGHDFPDVTLVGVLSADSSLYLDDYRASERTFSMLTQVIGRAGRGNKKGLAVIQTDHPDHEIIRLACAQDYDSFYEREIRLRKLLMFPPFCDIALLTVTGAHESEVLRSSTATAERMTTMLAKDYRDVQVIRFGPFEAPVYRVDNQYRMRMVIKCRLNKRTLAMFSDLLCFFGQKIGKTVQLSIDFNPSNL